MKVIRLQDAKVIVCRLRNRLLPHFVLIYVFRSLQTITFTSSSRVTSIKECGFLQDPYAFDAHELFCAESIKILKSHSLDFSHMNIALIIISQILNEFK